MMYNKALKEKFISEYTSANTTSAYLVSIFTTTATSENRYNCDVAMLSTEKLQMIFNDNFGIRERGRLYVLNVLKDYVEWYFNHTEKPEQAIKLIEMYRSSQQSIWGVNLKNTDKLRKKMIASPKELLSFLDAVFESPNENSVSCIYRSFLWLAFIGIADSDAVRLKINDVDLDKKVINYNNDTYRIYDEAIPDFKNACMLEEFSYNHPKYKKATVKKRLPGDELIRGIGASSRDVQHLRTYIWRMTKNYNNSIKENSLVEPVSPTYHSLMLSGLFYRIYLLEVDGIDYESEIVDFVDKKIKNKDENGVGYKVTADKNLNSIKSDNIKELKKDYEHWKIIVNK